MKFHKKSLGQNFLIDLNIIKKIVNIISLEGKNILEIGPGKGALTNEILKKKPKSVILVEKDYVLAKNLKNKFKHDRNIKIYNQDILKFDLESKLKDNSIVFGNLPYNISSQILIKTIKFKSWPPKYEALVFMFQKELAEKIIGKYKTINYGRLSIITNYRLNVFNKFIISPNCFFPKPKIKSMILGFKPKKKINYKIKNIDSLEKITRILFSNKRKMINKSIKKIFKKDKKIPVINLNLKLRPENLKQEIIYEITEKFEQN